jgi:hypothetical protein
LKSYNSFEANMMVFTSQSLMVILLWSASLASGFHLQWSRQLSFCSPPPTRFHNGLAMSDKNYDQGEVGKGPNWIEKSFPVDTQEVKKVDDYNLGISGEAFQTGPLSKRMFEAIVSRTALDMTDEIREAFTLYAMDFTAKEATRAALEQNGMVMVLQEEEEDQGMWGDVEAVRLYDANTGIAFSSLYDSLEEAVKDWAPGQNYDFVVRQVPAKIKELSVEELMQALDPDGNFKEEVEALKDEDDTADAGDFQ